MKKTMKKMLAVLLVVCLMLAALPGVSAEAQPNGEKIVYGYSGEGRELVAYRFGSGSQVMVLGFAIHGWEDNFERDGEALVYTAEQLMEVLKKTDLVQRHGWTVYVLPCMNPDGLYNGYTENGPGRCTTRRLDSDGDLVKGGVDMNRCFPTGFRMLTNARNYTGVKPMSCLEAKALSDFLNKVKGSEENILVDTHGWYQQIIVHTDTNGKLYRAFYEQFPQNRYTKSNQANGYLTEYAYSLGYDTCLFEFPGGLYSMSAYKRSGYCEKYIASIKTILDSTPELCAQGHDDTVSRKEPSCTGDGEEVRTCNRCGDVRRKTIPALGHAFDRESAQVIQERTATRDGYVQYTCQRCSAQVKELSEKRVFSDTDSARFYADAVDYAYKNGLVTGTKDDIFSPDMDLTRGMLVTILHRMEGSPDVEKQAGFRDVQEGRYYAKAVDWAYENGIITGMSETSFAPEEPVTRQQTAAILFRYVQSKEKDNEVRASLEVFGDAKQVHTYAQEPMAWCVGNGIIKGVSTDRLAPAERATRAQSVVMLYRVVEYLEQ